MRKAYGLSPGQWVLVRPDGYLAGVVCTETLAALEKYLAQVGIVAG